MSGSWTSRFYQQAFTDTGSEKKHEQETPLGRLDWADWDSNGDLLFAREGRLYRLEPQRKNGVVDVSAPREVADLRGYVFENRLAPPSVTQW